jgi:hypothetical protein
LNADAATPDAGRQGRAATDQWFARTGEFLLLLLVLLAGWSGCSKSPDPASAGAGHSSASDRPWFEEITLRSGIHFLHDTGPSGGYRVPEQMGSGAACFDYDGDGRLDLYFVQNGGAGSAAANQLYHQEADGRFRDVSAGSGLNVTGAGMGVAVGDVNNDGRPDVLLTEYGGVRLFINQGGGKFVEVTESAGLDNPRWATSAAFFDYDRDGWLDLVVGNYLDYDPSQRCTDASGSPEFCGPHGFPGLVTRLFHNLGAAAAREGLAVRFEDVTATAGLAAVPGPALGVMCADFDGDHWPDIFLADDGRPNRLFINQRNGTFVEEAVERGLAWNGLGQTAGNMGIALGDVDGDGWFDVFVTHLAEEQHALWTQRPRGSFQDRVGTAGLANPAWRGTGFGTVLADFNLDGALDLAIVNGLVKRRPAGASGPEPMAPGVRPFWAPYAQRAQLFANDGRGNFRETSAANSAFCGRAVVGRGLAWGDLDNDGAVDLVVTSTGGPAQIFRNVAPRAGHWLTLRLLEPSHGGRDAHGAEVRVQAGTSQWWRLLQPASSYLCSSDPRVHFGLGQLTRVEAIEVLWPDGTAETFPGMNADQSVILRQGSGQRKEP